MKHLLLLLLLTGLVACDKTPPARHRTASALLVETTEVLRSPLTDTRLVSGSLQARAVVRIFNQEEGRILELPFYPGDRVKKGELLVRIDDSLIRAQLNKAIANLKQAKLDAQRIISLSKKKMASEDELARVQTAQTLAQTEVNLLRTRLSHTRIKAPLDAVVSQRFNEPGDVVAKYSQILTLIDRSQLKIVVTLSELLLANIREGDRLEVRIDALGDQRFPARVSRLYPTIDEQTRQGRMEVLLETVPDKALPGQLSRIIIRSSTSPRLNVPFAAIRHDSRGEYVFRLRPDNHIERVRVQTGIQLGDRIEILAGLKAGEQIVSKGFIGLKDGAKVKALPATPANTSDASS